MSLGRSETTKSVCLDNYNAMLGKMQNISNVRCSVDVSKTDWIQNVYKSRLFRGKHSKTCCLRKLLSMCV